jgi:hypothetical protein
MKTENHKQITVRLPAEAAEQLRATAFAAKLQTAALARRLIVMALAEGKNVPPAAPPATADLDPAARELLATMAACVSNFSQLKKHAREIGGRLAGISEEGQILDQLSNECRGLGLHLKQGRPCPPAQITSPVHEAAVAINALSKRLNIDRTLVTEQEWARPVLGFKMPIRSANAWVESGVWR